jgi:hypothetical protein
MIILKIENKICPKIGGRGECHLFQIPPPTNRKKKHPTLKKIWLHQFKYE